MRLKSVLVLLVIFSLAVFGAAGCKTTTTKKTTTKENLTVRKVTIEIKDFAFKPEKITIGRKSRVTWTNKDAGTHTIEAAGFSSGPLGQDESYSLQFTKVGTFPYRCTLHPYMEGTIIVK